MPNPQYVTGTPEFQAYQRKRAKAWRERNPERNKELAKVCNARDRAKFHEKRKSEQRARYHSDVDSSRQKLRGRTAVRRRLVLEHYGLTCAICGESRYEFLTIDHTHGGGTDHRRAMGLAGHAFYIWLTRNQFPPGFRTLCMSCNQIAGKRPALKSEKWRRVYAYNARQRAKVMEHYGGKCACCGEANQERLCIDHANGGGSQERKVHNRRGSRLYVWLVRNGFPEGYRALCHNCNFALGHYGYCPHERERTLAAAAECERVAAGDSWRLDF